MNWIATWLAAERQKRSGYSADSEDYADSARSIVQIVRLLSKLYTARQERDLARTKLSEAMTAWRADLDSYNVILCKSGIGDLREKVRNLEHEVMGLMIAYRELAEARATIVTLTAERDSALSRLGEWRPLIEAMEKTQ